MTLRGLIFLFFVLIFIPVFLGKVSIGEFVDLLKRPTSVKGEQWRNAAQMILEDAYKFYLNLSKNLYERFRPQIEEKAKEYKVDETLQENRKFIDESLKVLKQPK
jgi:hypothetical protein